MQTILLVEDDGALRYVMERHLMESGYRMIGVAHTEAALEVLDKEIPITLLLTDVMMPPGMPTGLELIEVAKRKRPDLLAVAVTGHPAFNVPDESAPGVRVLRKPISPEALLEVIRDTLTKAARPGEAGGH